MKTMTSLKEFGQIVMNEEKESDNRRCKKTIKDADIAITSWLSTIN